VNIICKILHSRWTVVLQLECSVLHWALSGRFFAAGGEWNCGFNVVCYSEHYLEDSSQQVDSGIAAWMKSVTVNIITKVLHTSRLWYRGLNVVCYNEHYLEDTSQQVDSGIAGWMYCVTVNIICIILYSRWIVLLRLECSVLHWTLSGRYFTAGGQWHFGLNVMCYSEHYLEVISLQVDSRIAASVYCVTVIIMWKLLHAC